MLKRWIPAISMILISLLSYIDRNTLAILAPAILKESHLSAQQYGFIISCFSVAYMIGNPVWGLLLDRTGVRRGMSAAVYLGCASCPTRKRAQSCTTHPHSKGRPQRPMPLRQRQET